MATVDIDQSLKLVKIDMKDAHAYADVVAVRSVLLSGLAEEHKPVLHAEDEVCDIYALYDAGEAVGTARVHPTDEGLKLERIAVVSHLQGKGIGKSLMAMVIIKYAHEGKLVYLYSQTHASPFYIKCGFQTVGDEFMQAGIKHIKMVYSQTPAAN